MFISMRLWSLHPRYLDARGLTACWREGLLARAVLSGKTAGYRRHPQLERFRASANPLAAIDAYLWAILDEAGVRGYHFDKSKVKKRRRVRTLPVPTGQLDYEWAHLKAKLKIRDPLFYRKLVRIRTPRPHPLFTVVRGPIASWERVRRKSGCAKKSSAMKRSAEIDLSGRIS
jgi:hypothetical protein